MKDIYQEALALHKNNQGKLELASRVPLRNKKDLSLVYTPGVSAVCQAIAKDKKKSFSHSFRGNTVAVISDGSAVLGLGNIGPEAGLPVMEGKAVLFKKLAGVDAFPLCLGTQDTEEIIKTIKYLAPSFGAINLEDIAAPRCFEIEARLRKELDIPVVHDDQHITAVVVLAGLINALKLRKLDKNQARVVINGAGAAGIAIAKLLHFYGFKDLIVCDRQGAIYRKRPGLAGAKKEIAQFSNRENRIGSLEELIGGSDIFIGVSSANVLRAEMIKAMNQQPIIFALANPVPEIDPGIAKKAGAFIVATGRSDFPNQVNNVLAFPGIFKGLLQRKVKQLSLEIMVKVAQVIAKEVSEPKTGHILPSALDRKVASAVAAAIR